MAKLLTPLPCWRQELRASYWRMRWYRGLEIVSGGGRPKPLLCWVLILADPFCHVRWGRGLKCRGNQGFNNKMKQKNINHPEGEKTSRQAEDWSTVKHLTHMTWTHERQRISTGLQTQGDYIGRQTRVTRETQLEPLKQWLSNKMGGDRQSTWEHMAPNKQQAMCSTHRDIWWPAWAHQQDRDNLLS